MYKSFWAAIIFVLGLVIFSAGFQIAKKDSTSVNEAKIRAELVENFRHFNDGWFDGDLSQNTRIMYYNMGPDFAIGDMTSDGAGQFTIFINSYYDRNPREAEFTEFHEMCHEAIALRGNEFEEHGPAWQGCMHRLANAGAFENLW